MASEVDQALPRLVESNYGTDRDRNAISSYSDWRQLGYRSGGVATKWHEDTHPSRSCGRVGSACMSLCSLVQVREQTSGRVTRLPGKISTAHWDASSHD